MSQQPRQIYSVILRCGEHKKEAGEQKHVETTAHRICLTPNNRPGKEAPHLEAVPFLAGESLPAQGKTCYLQLWELDYFQTERFRVKVPVMKKVDKDGKTTLVPDTEMKQGKKVVKTKLVVSPEPDMDAGPRENELIATFQGVVVDTTEKGKRTIDFRPTAEPVLAQKTPTPGNGEVILELKPLNQDKTTYRIPLPHYEGTLELAATLRTTKEDKTYKDIATIAPYQVRNVKASLYRQIRERGGFAVALVADYVPAKSPSNTALQKAARKYAGNTEFKAEAENMINLLPTFSVGKDGALQMGINVISSYRQIGGILSEIRGAAKTMLEGDEAGKGLLKNGEPPKVAVLELYGHGGAEALSLHYSGIHDGSKKPLGRVVCPFNLAGDLLRSRVSGFVASIREHLARDVVIPICACLAGREPRDTQSDRVDKWFGVGFACEEMGGDSLAWTLYHELRRSRLADGTRFRPTIWAHTVTAHCMVNKFLRAFSPYGCADLVNLLVQAPRALSQLVNSYSRIFAKVENSLPHRQSNNLLRAISVQNARFFFWEWNGGKSVDPLKLTDAYIKQGANRVRDILKEARKMLPEFDDQQAGQAEPFTYDAGRMFLIGLTPKWSEYSLSEHIKFGDVKDLPRFSDDEAKIASSKAFRIKVPLMKYIQLLRYRAGLALQLESILCDGEGMALKPKSGSAAELTKLEEAARKMTGAQLFTDSKRAGTLLYVFHKGALRDALENSEI
jgi:hypothetical protein